MSENRLPVTKEWLDAQLKDYFGQEAAERRKWAEGMGKKINDARQPQPWQAAIGRTAGKALKPGALVARTLASVVAGKALGDSRRGPIEFAEKKWGGGPDNEPVLKALQAGDFSAGGVLTDTTISDDFIEFLTASVAVMSFNPVREPMPGGTAAVRKELSNPTATYRGENAPVNASGMDFGWVHLSAKELISKVPVSNKLIRFSPDAIEERVLRAMQRQISLRADLAFIQGDGTANTPKGLLHWAHSDNKFDANATVNHQNVANDLGKAELKIVGADIPAGRLGWIFAPRTENFLKYLLTADGAWAFQAEMTGGTLIGHPFATSTQVPKTLGGSNNESKVYLGDFDQVIFGDVGTVQVATTTEGSYKDASGTVQSAFDNDETVLRVIVEHDLAVRYDRAIAVIEAVKWGA